MRGIILVVVCMFLSSVFSAAPHHDLPQERHILADAHYSGRGMQSWMDGEHLIARIYSDGTVEYEDVELKNNVPGRYMRRAALSKDELRTLSELLNSRDVRGLAGKYAALATTVGRSEDLLLWITTGGQVKDVTVENFTPNLPEAGVKYPKGLLRVACWAERARKDAQARFFFKESTPACKLP